MVSAKQLTLRTYVLYFANALLSTLFLMWFSNILWLQCVLGAGLLAGFGMLCFNEGGTAGEHDCTLERTMQKREQEGKKVDPEMKKQFYNRKVCLVVLLAVSVPLFALSTVNLIASRNYPEISYQEDVEAAQDDPFYYDAEKGSSQQEESSADAEPGYQTALRVVTRLVFAPLLPLYTLLQNHQTALYSLFVPFSFVFPLCTAIGYWRGPKIREKKLMLIAKGKVRKKRGLLVNKNNGPKQPKPMV